MQNERMTQLRVYSICACAKQSNYMKLELGKYYMQKKKKKNRFSHHNVVYHCMYIQDSLYMHTQLHEHDKIQV